MAGCHNQRCVLPGEPSAVTSKTVVGGWKMEGERHSRAGCTAALRDTPHKHLEYVAQRCGKFVEL